jgi:hypothetical protein
MTKKATTNDQLPIKSWPAAVVEASRALDVQLPNVVQQGMGCVLWRNSAGNRLVSFKRRFVARSAADDAGVEWTLWHEKNDDPSAVFTFREPLQPTRERAEFVVSVLKGWLLDNWSDEVARSEVEKQPSWKAEPIV